MRHRGPPHGRPPRGWLLARGIHRTVVAFLVVAAALGALGGAALHAAVTAGDTSRSIICIALAVLGALWPLAWVATLRIAWPLRALASVAGELRGGRLQMRESLPTGPGEVGQVADALHGMAERVARQLRDQRALMAAVSHELRSPLGRARVLVEMAREGSAPPTLHDDLEEEIDAMDGLVGDLLAAARIDFEAITPRALGAADLARRALEIARLPPDALELDGDRQGGREDPPPGPPLPALRAAGSSLRSPPGDPGQVLADPTLLARALASLLDNARRYGGTDVRLRVRGRLARVRFEVEDDGPGFAPGDTERAFQPFWRGPTADGRPVPRGEGLGLALVRQIAEAHRGEAGAENRREGGARVWIELPRPDAPG